MCQKIHFTKLPFMPDSRRVVFIEKGYNKELNIALDKLFAEVLGDEFDERNQNSVRKYPNIVIEAFENIDFMPYQIRQTLGISRDEFYDNVMPELGNLYSFIDGQIEKKPEDFTSCGFLHFPNELDDEQICLFYDIDSKYIIGLSVYELAIITYKLKHYSYNEYRHIVLRHLHHSRNQGKTQTDVNSLSVTSSRLEVITTNSNWDYKNEKLSINNDVASILRTMLKSILEKDVYNKLRFNKNVPIMYIKREHYKNGKPYYTLSWNDENKVKVRILELALFLTLFNNPIGFTASELNWNNTALLTCFNAAKENNNISQKPSIKLEVKNVTRTISDFNDKIEKSLEDTFGRNYKWHLYTIKTCKYNYGKCSSDSSLSDDLFHFVPIPLSHIQTNANELITRKI